MNTASKITATLAITLACSGCGASGGRASISQWQQSVERYIQTRGHGDPNSIRDADPVSTHRLIALHGGEDPDRSTDVTAVVLGPGPNTANPQLIFILAVVDQGRVQDIRVATLAGVGDKLAWRLGPPNSKTLAAYTQSSPRSSNYPPWPRPEDVFDLQVSGETITVTERRSNATWTLPLTSDIRNSPKPDRETTSGRGGPPPKS